MSKEDLHARLSNLVKAAPVMLFMKGTPSAPQCGFSRQLVALLREKSVKYGFFNILADDEVRQGLKEFADWPTFPQLWMDGELVGGLDIVSFFLPFPFPFLLNELLEQSDCGDYNLQTYSTNNTSTATKHTANSPTYRSKKKRPTIQISSRHIASLNQRQQHKIRSREKRKKRENIKQSGREEKSGDIPH